MNEALILAGSLLAGILLGTFFFGGLWWTIRMGPDVYKRQRMRRTKVDDLIGGSAQQIRDLLFQNEPSMV